MTTKLRIAGIMLVAALTVIVAGCGYYSFSGAVPGGVKTIAVPLFDNNTSEFGIREQLTDAVVERFLRDNIVKVVDLGQAQTILRGTILNVTDEPYTFQETETVQEYRVFVTINVTMENTETGDAMWKQQFSEWGTYPLSSGGSAERDVAVTDAVSKLTEDISNKVVSGW
jgi:outer membrane lipopolysaccharide assembly protein LptE/RlpB